MKLLIQSAMVFFGTLIAAALVALGEPGKADVAIATSAAPPAGQDANHYVRNDAWLIELASSKGGFSLR